MNKIKLKDIYNQYVLDTKSEISYKEFSTIFHKYIIKSVDYILKGHKVYLPSRMGSIQVKGKKQEYKIEDGVIKGLAPDWKATKDFREKNPGSTKVLFHTNDHTDNVRYKIRWSKFNIYAKHKSLYYLRFTRAIKRELSAKIKNKSVEYEVL